MLATRKLIPVVVGIEAHREAKLPQLGEGLGKAIKGFKKSVHEADAIEAEAQAAAQQATRDFEAAMQKAHEAATRIHSAVWGCFGKGSEKLHEFGMRPYRFSPSRKPSESSSEE
mgnify:CR=1 FL=1